MKEMREVSIEDRIRDARKRLNVLILLVAFTAILLIATTYAWFSTQRNVTLGGLEGEVNVAEGLQISLDALNWANEIDLSNNAAAYFASTNETNGWTDDDRVSLVNPWKQATDGTSYEARTNLIPSELLPASTTAQSTEGIGLNDVKMYRGEVESGNKLNRIEKLAAEADSGYYAIDFFLQNSSSQEAITGNTKDLLRVESNSSINLNESSRESTGLQNTLRVAFAIYDEDAELAEDTVVGSSTANQDTILAATTGDDRVITDVAIWEPNASGAQVGSSPAIERYAAHVDYIVQNNNKLTLSSADRTSLTSSTSRFDADDPVPTYALTATSVGKAISDIYNWDTTAATNGLVKQNTVQTPNTGIVADNPVQLKSVADGTTDFAIAPGKYIHMRMYVWLEGQDVDCINYASLGGGLTIDVGLSKPGSENLPDVDKEVIDTDTEYIGYYADIDGDDTVDGIIYADLAVGKSGEWGKTNKREYSYATETGLKEYYISQSNYVGPFGTKDVITVLEGSGGKDRFYVMALEDFNDGEGPYYTWYDAAYDDGGQMDDYATTTSTDFGTGKNNTETMIAKWNASDYGPQDDNENYKDMWGAIQEEVEEGWFVPSISEWCAFGDNLNITEDNYVNYDLSDWYWSSSQGGTYGAWSINFNFGYMSIYSVRSNDSVRLSATF